jgi:di/tricarboxylate transporter
LLRRSTVSLHLVGVGGLALVFLIGTLRPINLGAVALGMTLLFGAFAAGGAPRDLAAGFPVDLLVLLAGVTYLFAIAQRNGTVESVVRRSTRLVAGRRALLPWAVFVLAALPAMAGALGSAGVAMLAPFSLRLAERHQIDRRMIGLMVVHGAGAGNFSPLNVLGAIVQQAVARAGLPTSALELFEANLIYNTVLAGIAFVAFGGLRLGGPAAGGDHEPAEARFGPDQLFTLLALVGVAVGAFGYGLNVGFLAFFAAALLQIAFPATSAGAEKGIAWDTVLLVCGLVTYVAALQRFGTVEAAGAAIANAATPRLAALLLCAIGAVTSAFASSAAILGALVPLAVPLMSRGDVAATGMVLALAISATVVDATPFSTVGALVVANAAEAERQRVYRGLLAWGALMVATAPPITWLLFIVGGS